MLSVVIDFVKFLGVLIIVLLAVMTPILGLIEIQGQYKCNNYKNMTGKETQWRTLDACYVKTKTGYQRWDEYKARATTNE